MKVKTNLSFRSKIYFMLLSLFFVSGWVSVSAAEAATDPLIVTVEAPDEVSKLCDVVNVAISVAGGTPPYTVTWLQDGSQQVLPGPGVLATWLLEIPDQAGTWDFDMVEVVDDNGASVTKFHSIEVDSWWFCYQRVIENVTLSTSNSESSPYGQGCAIEGTIEWDEHGWSPGVATTFYIENAYGEPLYWGWDNIAFNVDNFTIPANSLPQEDYVDNEVTDIIYLEIRMQEGTVWVVPIHMYPDKITSSTPIVTECRTATDNELNNWVNGAPVRNPRDLGLFCLGSSNSATWGFNAEVNYSLSLEGSIPIPPLGRLAKILSSDLGFSFGGSVGWSTSYTFEWNYSFEECDKCRTEDGQPSTDCSPNVPLATAAHPKLLINEELIKKTIEYMDCDGNIIIDIVDLEYVTFSPGVECVIKESCPDNCKDKEGNFHYELPDKKVGSPGFIYSEMKNGEGPFEYQWSVRKPLEKAKDGNKKNRGSDTIGSYSSEEEMMDEKDNTITTLEPGLYCFTITDSHCCEVEDCIEITCVFDADIEVEEIPCPENGVGGSITLTPLNAVDPVEYTWSNGATTQTIQGLSLGIYTVTATDSDGCYFIADIPVDSEGEAGVSGETTPSAVCKDNGSIVLELKGKPWDYDFFWDDGTTSQNRYNLEPGEYCVTVTGSTGCKNILCFTVEAIPPMTLTLDVEPSCGKYNGRAEAFVTGGTPPYTYFWSGGYTGSVVTSLPAGLRLLVVTDADGCQRSQIFNVEGSPYMKIFPYSNIPCSGEGIFAAVSVSGGTPPISYQWSNGAITSSISDVDPGFYYVDVIDAIGCTERVEFDLNYTGDLIITATSTPEITGCHNNTGSMQISVTGGAPPYEYHIGGTNGYQLTTPNPNIDNLESATYTVTVFDNCGNFAWIPVVIYPETNGSPFSLTLVPEGSCDNSPSGSGAVNLTVNGTGSYDYFWSTGATTQDLTNIPSGTYTVIVTNEEGCERHGSVVVNELPGDFMTTSTITHSCGVQTIGAIDQEVNLPGNYTYQWSNGATTQSISGLAAGTYTVTITNDVGCEEVHTYTISNIQDFDYEVEVLYHFDNSFYTNGSAQILISSDQFEIGGDIFIAETGQEIFIDANNPTERKINIPLEFSNVSTFHFTYIGPNGCEFEGTFDMIPSCTFPDSGFSFDVEHQGNGQGSCGVGQSHTYLINVFGTGNNVPYYIDVTMSEASHPSEADYFQRVEYTGQNPFYIYGVPAGTVRFDGKNHCEYGSVGGDSHTNCCFDISCDILWDTPSDVDDGSHVYDYPYFRLWVKELCYDEHCGGIGHDPSCSKIEINLGTAAPTFNCWTGTVTIEYPDGSTGVFEVIANSPGNDQIEWVSGSDDWKPGGPGTYFVNISYVGNGASTGQDCQTEHEVNWYGPTNYNDAVGLNDNFWFDVEALGAPSYFENSYFGSWRCKSCTEDPVYIYNNDQGDCASFDNWDFTFFSYEPNSYSNPCNSGGTLTIMDFDANGVATIQTVQVDPNSSLGQVNGMQPFGIDVNTWCGNSGWCLFDAMDVYGFSMDKPLLATWADPQSCDEVVWTDPSEPNPDPCLSNDDCPPGFVCQNGDCFQECPEGECLYGNCVNGICVEDEVCNPSCAPGYECIDGDCYLDENICDFYVEVNGGSGVNTYDFYHNLPAGTTIHFGYNTLTRYDEIQITGSGINDHIQCVGTGGWANKNYVVNGGNVISVTVTPCETGSRYHLDISCTFFQEGGSGSTKRIDNPNANTTNGIFVHPNPFVSNIDITASSVEVPFAGQVVLLDNLGREVIKRAFAFEAGYNTINIDGLEDLLAGVYIVLIKKDGEVYTAQKVVKVE